MKFFGLVVKTAFEKVTSLSWGLTDQKINKEKEDKFLAILIVVIVEHVHQWAHCNATVGNTLLWLHESQQSADPSRAAERSDGVSKK